MDLERLTPAPWCVGFWAEDWETGGMAVCSEGRGMVCEITNQLEGLYQQRFDVKRTFENQETNARFIALARNAFDVMMRRGWWPVPRVDGKWVVHFTKGSAERWMICYHQTNHGSGPPAYADPFTAIVEADKWYKENVEGSAGS